MKKNKTILLLKYNKLSSTIRDNISNKVKITPERIKDIINNIDVYKNNEIMRCVLENLFLDPYFSDVNFENRFF